MSSSLNRSLLLLLFAALLPSSISSGYFSASAQQWPTPLREAGAGARWWWMGSAVDKENLQWNMQQYADHGIRALEITPLYGVQGNDANDIPYLSDKWMEMLREVQRNGKQMNIEIDMATGTGWPFGGPWVPLEESASKMVFVQRSFSNKRGAPIADLDISAPEKDRKYSKLVKVMAFANWKPDTTKKPLKDLTKAEIQAHLQNIPRGTDITGYVKDGKLNIKKPAFLGDDVYIVALYARYGVMKVKRAAPGGEGWVIDHFDSTAVANYLKHISDAFERTATPYPHTFFNDSYEVSDATWTPTLLDEFAKRRGYRLEEYLYHLICGWPEVVSDYRETLGDLLLENFTEQWTAWAHSHGAITRNQAHGSPANLIDCYAAVDIPEIEGFGLSDLGIKGLRTDPGKTRKNDSDYSMFKYAPSAAHVCGKPFTSSETFTWLTEHFRTSLSQLKPDLDLMFCAGVNHMFFHGTAYSPKNDPWPGWKFYASIDMSPTNSIWRDAGYFTQYVERCQSFLQWGQPDNDFLVYLPIRDMWQKNTHKLLMQFSIHAMGKLAPEFRQAIIDIDKAGFDCDYISERLLMGVTYSGGILKTAAGTRYRALIIPGSGNMPASVKLHIDSLQSLGAHVIYGVDVDKMKAAARPEPMKTQWGLKAIRRSNHDGHHYFIANLTPNDIEADVPLAVDFKSATLFDPMTGNIRPATIKAGGKVHLSLRSGESIILKTATSAAAASGETAAAAQTATAALPREEIEIDTPWTLTFTDEAPRVAEAYHLNKLQTWETLGDSVAVTMGTGVYTTTFSLSKQQAARQWQIELGDVRESARVYINNVYLGCAWAVPFVLDCGTALQKGKNTLRIEVTNLPANRISDLDRRGVLWRKMKEINVVDINYKKTTYADWQPMPSGLNSPVKLVSR